MNIEDQTWRLLDDAGEHLEKAGFWWFEQRKDWKAKFAEYLDGLALAIGGIGALACFVIFGKHYYERSNQYIPGVYEPPIAYLSLVILGLSFLFVAALPFYSQRLPGLRNLRLRRVAMIFRADDTIEVSEVHGYIPVGATVEPDWISLKRPVSSIVSISSMEINAWLYEGGPKRGRVDVSFDTGEQYLAAAVISAAHARIIGVQLNKALRDIKASPLYSGPA